MEVRADRAGELVAPGDCCEAIRISGAHAGQADLDASAAGGLELPDQLAQNTMRDRIAVCMRQHRDPAGRDDAQHRLRQ